MISHSGYVDADLGRALRGQSEHWRTEQATDLRVAATVWTEGVESTEGEVSYVEVERTDVDEIALHMFDHDGQGSIFSTYWSRERAIEIARQLLNAAALR
jgi:predicted dithiol-disulfide oxidoreductase (DUF899 family)